MFLLTGAVFAAPVSNNSFIRKILPAIKQSNHKVLLERKRLQNDYSLWKKGKVLSKKEWRWLRSTAKKYKLAQVSLYNDDDWEKLLNRVDIIPESLVLAQAINESAWGKSRFAKQGNNFFGKWCYHKGCGIVPRRRPANRKYEVKKYPSIEASIDDYLLNINTNTAYKNLRDMRQQMHKQSKELNAMLLANGLSRYSTRGEAYVKNIQGIIVRYELNNV